MRRRGDIKCYHCGQVLGTLEWRGQMTGPVWFTPAGGRSGSLVRLGQLRCQRCRGPVFLDEFDTVALDPAELLAAARDENTSRRRAAS